MTDDADYVLRRPGHPRHAGARHRCRRLREQGHKVGFARLKWFRPFPTEEIVQRLTRLQGGWASSTATTAFGSPNHGGVLYTEIRAALYDSPKRPPWSTSSPAWAAAK